MQTLYMFSHNLICSSSIRFFSTGNISSSHLSLSNLFIFEELKKKSAMHFIIKCQRGLYGVFKSSHAYFVIYVYTLYCEHC